MADWANVQRVQYGDLEAVYNDLPFTLTHWQSSRASIRNDQGAQMGHRVRIACTGYVEAAGAEQLAELAAQAREVLAIDGGDFRVQLPADDGEGGLDWHTVEQVLSADTLGGVQVEDLTVTPAGGNRLDISLTLTAEAEMPAGYGLPGLAEGCISSTIDYEWTSGDEQRSVWKASGELRSEQGADARLIWQASVLPVVEQAVPFGNAQSMEHSTSEESGTVCRWDYTATKLTGGYPAGVTGGERDITESHDEHFGVVRVDRGRYIGTGAQAYVDGLLAQAADAVAMEKAYSEHQLQAVSWQIVRRGARPGQGDCCVEFRQTIRHQWSRGACIVKEYLGAEPIIISPQAQPVLRFVQEGRAVSRDPDVIIRAPERSLPGHESAIRQIDVERPNRRQVVTTWRYETVSVGIPPHPFVRPTKRDESATVALLGGGVYIAGAMTS